jgi:hypothetical protein
MQFSNKAKRITVLSTVLILALIIFYWFYSHAQLEINISNPGGGQITYEISNQSKKGPESIKTQSTSLKRSVAKGSYEISVSQGEQSYFALVKTDGFFSKSKVVATLAKEKQRSFAGNNPAPCMFYNGQLYTYTCNGAFSDINKHVPATASEPTFVVKNSSTKITGILEGLINTPQGSVALLHSVDLEGPGGHSAYVLDGNLNPLKQAALKVLKSDDSYSLKSYQSGFLVYDSKFEQVFYYAGIEATPKSINIERPENDALQPVALGVNGSSILTLYTSSANPASLSTKTDKNARNEIIISRFDQNGGLSSKKIDIDGYPINSAVLCGQEKICVQSGSSLLVYDESGGGNPLYSIRNASSVESVGGNVILVRSSGILNFNPDTKSGSYDYTFGDYRYCGIKKSNPNQYVLCITSGSGKSAALLVDQGAANIDSIDKKIQKLQKSTDLTDISIYGKYIFFTPDAGSLIYSPSLGGYDYDPNLLKSSGDKANQEIDKLGINRNTYTIINVLAK